MLKFTSLGMSAVLAGGIALSAASVEAAEDKSIKARKAVMTVMAYYIGGLGAMAKGEVEYDADAAKAYAASLNHASQLDLSGMWPEGTDNVSMPDATAALPAIWENPAGVGEASQKLAETSTELANVAGDGLDAMKAGLGAVGKSCGACHEDYRQKKD